MSYAIRKDGLGCRAVASKSDCTADEVFSKTPLELPTFSPDYAELRAAAYRTEADPLFFKSQRGECSIEDWQAKIAEIRARFPKV